MIDKTLDRINKIVPQKWQWVLSHDGFRKYFKNTGWMFFGRIAGLIISFLTTIFIARRLGPGNYGQLSYAVSFVSIFSFLAGMGLDQVLFRDLVKHPEKRDKYLGSAFLIRFIAALVTLALCFGAVFVFKNNDVSKILIFIIASTFIFNSFQIINYEFQALVKAKYPSIVSLLVVVILNALKILVIALGKGVIYLAFILLLESILYAGFYLLIYKWKLKRRIINWSFDKKISLEMLRDSWPMIFSSAFALIYARIDQVMIKNMMNAESVGVYDAAVRISEAWYFVPNIIVSSFFPAIINAKLDSENKFFSRIKKLGILLIGISLLFALPVAIFSKFIMGFLFGPEFIVGASVLSIYIWSSVWTAIAHLSNNYLVAENFRKIIFISSFLAMSVNIILNFILIPIYGINGSAWATFISYMITPTSLLFFKKTRINVLKIIRS